MKHEDQQDENTSREALDMLGMRYPRWDNHVIRSLGDEKHVDPIRVSGLRLSTREYHVRMVARL